MRVGGRHINKLLIRISRFHPAVLAALELTASYYPLPFEWSGQPTSVVFDAKNHQLPGSDILRAIARSAIKLQLYGTGAEQKTQVDAWLLLSQSFADDVAHLNHYLSLQTFLTANRLTIADLAIFEQVTLWQTRFADASVALHALTSLPHLHRWYNLIAGQPAVEAALKHFNGAAGAKAAAIIAAVRAATSAKPLSASNPGAVRATKPPAVAVSKPAPAAAPKTKSIASAASPKPVPKKNETIATGAAGDRKQEGKFIDLPGAEMGKIVVRFPPEASGYLHIGHAKAALLNQFYQQAYEGTLIMRFDDTNPAKETVEFENVILEDLRLLEIQPDRFTHTSDHFDRLLELCERLIADGKAYADDTPAEQMKAERDERTESANRANSVERNFAMWREMLAGTEAGQKCCVRAKIDMQSANGCMRDPTIYRCKPEPHPRTGTKYRVYPTYDFACPVVDSVENVTHALRTTEYLDRDDQFYWFCDALGLRKPYIWSYSRLNMTNTVLSKRKLTWFVNEGLVDGWDDPRFPTVRGILRRGMTVKGLKEFIVAQGSSRSVVFMEWDKIWTFNKKVIDPVAKRFTALERGKLVRVNVGGRGPTAPQVEVVEVALHPKDASIGVKRQYQGECLLIEAADAADLREGEFATFINWGNMLVQKIHRGSGGEISAVDVEQRLDNTDFKKTLKLTWLCDDRGDQAEAARTPAVCVFFEHIIARAVLGKTDDFKDFVAKDTRVEVPMWGEPALAECREGEIVQLTRRGFFRVDRAFRPASEYTGVASPVVLFAIPDGHTKVQPTAGKAAAAANGKAVSVRGLESVIIRC